MLLPHWLASVKAAAPLFLFLYFLIYLFPSCETKACFSKWSVAVVVVVVAWQAGRQAVLFVYPLTPSICASVDDS